MVSPCAGTLLVPSRIVQPALRFGARARSLLGPPPWAWSLELGGAPQHVEDPVQSRVQNGSGGTECEAPGARRQLPHWRSFLNSRLDHPLPCSSLSLSLSLVLTPPFSTVANLGSPGPPTITNKEQWHLHGATVTFTQLASFASFCWWSPRAWLVLRRCGALLSGPEPAGSALQTLQTSHTNLPIIVFLFAFYFF